jgi:hypothetical protein
VNAPSQAISPAHPHGKYLSPLADGFPSTEALLIHGGDARITLNPVTGTNQYGCPPRPQENIAALGSATATAISEDAFNAAQLLRDRLAQEIISRDSAEIYAREIQRVRQELLALCDLHPPEDPEVIFGASGTDCHLMAAQLAAASAKKPLCVLLVDAAETGSGVPQALTGHHFSSRAALGTGVIPGEIIEKSQYIDYINVSIRLADGSARPGAEVDAEFARHVVSATAAGQQVLLTMVDVSKTGLIAPSVACAVDLQQRFPDTLTILVDACQFRFSTATLRNYLAQGFMVGITGSKFLTGPSFSGALLIPKPLSRRLLTHSVADKLQLYSAQADWPEGVGAAHGLKKMPNFGLLLRWEGALAELRKFRMLDNQTEITEFLQTCATVINRQLNTHPLLSGLEVNPLNRSPFAAESGWDHIQTIFPFLLYKPGADTRRIPLISAETKQIYLALQDHTNIENPIQLAQPVSAGFRDGIEVSALRLCISSRLIVEALQNHGRSKQEVIGRIKNALESVAQLVKLDAENKV